MLRPRVLWCLLFAPVLLTLVVAGPGCGGAAEDPAVRQFFQASRYADTMTLGNIATVSLDPKTDGAVESFSIVSVTDPPETRELRLVDLAAALKEAQAADQEHTKEMKAYQDANTDAIDRVLKAESKSARVTGKDAEVQKAWMKLREQQKVHSKAVSDARTKLGAEKRVAELSIADRDVTAYNGMEYTKDVTVNARVRMPDGSTANKTIILTMQRAILKDEAGQDITGKWMFTRMQQK
jgi:hypothetical protein